ncbi:hypothetical protein HK104_004407 [Borealophlyctis nickersoniae]|nr:hypothetical protein HK104_004407 [Borealophlyctis nickersoniae]
MSGPWTSVPGFEGPLLASLNEASGTPFCPADDQCIPSVANRATEALRLQRAAEVCLKSKECTAFMCYGNSRPNVTDCLFFPPPLVLSKPGIRNGGDLQYAYIENGKEYLDIANVTRRAAGAPLPSPSSTPLPKPASPTPSTSSVSSSSSSSSSSSVNPAAFAVPIALVAVGLIVGGAWWWRRKRAPKNLEAVEFVEALGGGQPVVKHKG